MLKLVRKPSTEYWIADKSFGIGNADDNHLALSEAAIAPHHAKISFDGQQYLLRDLNSAIGTYVNNQRVNQKTLHHGDEIRIGSVTLEVIDPLDQNTQQGWCLVASANWLQGAAFALPFGRDGDKLKIGRADHCEVIFPETHLAREHIELTLCGDHLEVRALKPSNSTYINDQPVTHGNLYPGDKLRLDVYNFRVFGPLQLATEANAELATDISILDPTPQKRWKTRPTSPGNRIEEAPRKPPHMENLLLKLGAAIGLMGLLLLGVYLLNG